MCDSVLKSGEKYNVCMSCAEKIKYIKEPYCKKCGKPLEKEYEEYCGDCTGKATSFEYGRAVFSYNMYIRESISRFKYHGRKEYAEFYADRMYECCSDWIKKILPDALIPVPIHKKRYNKRGYNQSELIADKLGALCGTPVLSDYILRQKNTRPQKELTPVERENNLKNAFVITKKAKELYKAVNCVIIIDDIYTTGSTIEACSHILKENGVSTVYFLCVSIGMGF